MAALAAIHASFLKRSSSGAQAAAAALTVAEVRVETCVDGRLRGHDGFVGAFPTVRPE
jgi:hypothetical protein